jgi:hypothetical protein
MRRPTADLIGDMKRAEDAAREEADRLRLARYALEGRKPPGRPKGSSNGAKRRTPVKR